MISADQIPQPPSGGWSTVIYLVASGIAWGFFESVRKWVTDRAEKREEEKEAKRNNKHPHRRWDDDGDYRDDWDNPRHAHRREDD